MIYSNIHLLLTLFNVLLLTLDKFKLNKIQTLAKYSFKNCFLKVSKDYGLSEVTCVDSSNKKLPERSVDEVTFYPADTFSST